MKVQFKHSEDNLALKNTKIYVISICDVTNGLIYFFNKSPTISNDNARNIIKTEYKNITYDLENRHKNTQYRTFTRSSDVSITKCTKIFTTILNKVALMIVYNREIDHFHMRMINQRLADSIVKLCKTRLIESEMLIQKFNDINVLIEDSLYMMSPVMRFNTSNVEDILMKDVVFHNTSFYFLKCKIDMLKFIYYITCNKDFNDKKLNLPLLKELKKSLTKKKKERLYKSEYELNMKMIQFAENRRQKRRDHYLICDINQVSNTRKTSTVIIESTFNNEKSIDFDLLAHSLRTKSSIDINKETKLKNIQNKPNEQSELTKFHSDNGNKHKHSSFINHAPVINYTNINNYNNIMISLPEIKRESRRISVFDLFSSLNTDQQEIERKDNHPPAKEKFQVLDTEFDKDIINKLNSTVKRMSGNLITSVSTNISSDVSFTPSLKTSQDTRGSIFDLREFNTSPHPNMHHHSQAAPNLPGLAEIQEEFPISNFDFSNLSKSVNQLKKEDKFDPISIKRQIRGAITEKGYIKYNKGGSFGSMSFKGQISLELIENFEIKNKIFNVKIFHDKWTDESLFTSKEFNNNNIEVLSDQSNLRLTCRDSKNFVKIVSYKINLTTIDNLVDFQFKKEYSQQRQKLKCEMMFTINPKFLNKINLNRITAEVTIRQGINYSLYKSTSVSSNTSADRTKVNFIVKSEGVTKAVYGLGVIFDSQVEDMIESVRLSYLYTEYIPSSNSIDITYIDELRMINHLNFIKRYLAEVEYVL